MSSRWIVAWGFGSHGAGIALPSSSAVMCIPGNEPGGPMTVFNLVITFSVSAIDWRAHIGGLVAGAVTAAGLMYAPPARRNLVQGLTVAGVLGAVVLMVAVQTALLAG